MKQLLKNLEEVLVEIKSPLLYSLNEGLHENEIKSMEIENNFPLLPEIKDLYKWKNGSHTNFDKKIGTNWFLYQVALMSLDRAYAEYRYTVANDFPYYSKSYFPLFESMGEESLVIDCDPASITYKMILSYKIKHVYITEGVELVYDNLETMITSITKCYLEKAYYYRKISELDTDRVLQDEINNLHNPKVKYMRMT